MSVCVSEDVIYGVGGSSTAGLRHGDTTLYTRLSRSLCPSNLITFIKINNVRVIIVILVVHAGRRTRVASTLVLTWSL